MMYVYAITCSTSMTDAAPLGLYDQPVFLVNQPPIAAACTEHPHGPIAPATDNLLRHEQVAQWLLQKNSLLPARFGTCFDNRRQLCETLERNTRTLLEGLERVRGCVELGLRVLWCPEESPKTVEPLCQTMEPEPTAPAAARSQRRSGRDYMLARLAEERLRRDQQNRAELLAEQIHQPLAALAREATRRVLITPQMLLSSAYLVERDQVTAMRERVGALAAEFSRLRLLCTGPWPPYHFSPKLGTAGFSHA